MSILRFLLKSKNKMSKEDTKAVQVGKYTISSHAQNRVVDPKRALTKKDLLINLFGHSKNSETYTHQNETKQYDRVNNKNRTITHITKKRHVVKTIHKYHNNKKGKEEAYKNFKK